MTKEWEDLITNIVYIAGAMVAFITGCSVFAQRWHSIREGDNKTALEIEKSKEHVEISKADALKIVELAKATTAIELAKTNALAASQVADLIQQMFHIKQDLEILKNDDKLKNEQFLNAINEMEKMLDKLSESFTQFLITKASKQE